MQSFRSNWGEAPPGITLDLDRSLTAIPQVGESIDASAFSRASLSRELSSWQMVHHDLDALSGAGARMHSSYFDYVMWAWTHHRPVVVSPDLFWFECLAMVAKDMTNAFTSRHYKQKFGIADDAKVVFTPAEVGKLDVESMTAAVSNAGMFPFDVRDLFTPRFSTSTDRSRLASLACFCDIASTLMVLRGGCGFPAIRLQGSTRDWASLSNRLQHLGEVFDRSQRHLGEVGEIAEEIARLLREENLDDTASFFSEFVIAKEGPCGSGTETALKLGGWITRLYGLNADAEIRDFPHLVAKVFWTDDRAPALSFLAFAGIFGSIDDEEGVPIPDFGQMSFQKQGNMEQDKVRIKRFCDRGIAGDLVASAFSRRIANHAPVEIVSSFPSGGMDALTVSGVPGGPTHHVPTIGAADHGSAAPHGASYDANPYSTADNDLMNEALRAGVTVVSSHEADLLSASSLFSVRTSNSSNSDSSWIDVDAAEVHSVMQASNALNRRQTCSHPDSMSSSDYVLAGDVFEQGRHCFLPRTQIYNSDLSGLSHDIFQIDEHQILRGGHGLSYVSRSEEHVARRRDVVKLCYKSPDGSRSGEVVLTANHSIKVRACNAMSFSPIPAGDVREGDHLRAVDVDVVVDSAEIFALHTNVLAVEFENRSSTIFVCGPESSEALFVEVYGVLAPRPANDFVKVLRFRHFHGLDDALRTSPELMACRSALFQAGISENHEMKIFVEDRMADAVLASVQHHRRRLTPRDVVVSKAYERSVLDTVRNYLDARANWVVDEEAVDLGRRNHIWLTTHDFRMQGQDASATVVTVKRTFIHLQRLTSADVASVATRSTTDARDAGYRGIGNPRVVARRNR